MQEIYKEMIKYQKFFYLDYLFIIGFYKNTFLIKLKNNVKLLCHSHANENPELHLSEI
jgi:hypothetical protein